MDYFIEIKPQDKFRAEILTAQRQLLDCLKRCEMFKQVREAKLREIENLRSILKGVVELTKTLKTQMPKVKIKLEKKEFSRKQKPKSFYDYSTELKKLESSIEDIEKKLKEFEK